MTFLELLDMKKNIWALFDDRIGSNNIIKGILSELNTDDFDVVSKEISYTKLAKLPNLVKGASLLGITKESKENLQVNFPDIVLSATRRTASIS